MADTNASAQFSGFGTSPDEGSAGDDGGVFLLVISHEGSLTAAAYATEAGAMDAAFEYLEGEWDPGDERGSPEDRYLQRPGVSGKRRRHDGNYSQPDLWKLSYGS